MNELEQEYNQLEKFVETSIKDTEIAADYYKSKAEELQRKADKLERHNRYILIVFNILWILQAIKWFGGFDWIRWH